MKNIITILSISTMLLTSCGGDKKEATPTATPISVKIGGNGGNSKSPFVTASGKIESESSATMSTRLMGYVTKLNVKVGQKVISGQPLISINNSDLQAKKAQVDASITQATAAYTNAKKDYDRFVNLFAQQSATAKELDDMTARYTIAKASLEAAKQMRNEIMAQFAYTNIVAPFSGTITNTFVKEGDMANPGMPLVSLEGSGKMQVTAMVSENDIALLKNGMPAILTIKSLQKEVKGTVSEISLSAKNTGGQYLVKINILQKDTTILSGMFVNVQFPTAKKNVVNNSNNDRVLVPENALIRQGQLTGIYTIGENNIALLRWLRIGKTYGNEVEVLSGLSADENYIITADGKLFNGAKVQIN